MDFGGTATMGGGGPMITGTWINTKTGEEVTVRDSFMDGEDMVIMLTNGRQMTLSDFQDFVQQSEEEYDERGNMISATNGGGIQTQNIPKPHHKPANVDAATVFAGMDEKSDNTAPQSDLDEVMANVQANAQEAPLVNDETPKKAADAGPEVSEGLKAAMKVIHRASSPKFKVVIEWPDFPEKELNMCKDYFDTTNDDIANAIIGMHCTGHELEAAVAEWLRNKIS